MSLSMRKISSCYRGVREISCNITYTSITKMADERNNYFKVKKVINFDIIHHQGRGDPLHKSEKEHHTIVKEDF